MPKTRAQSLTVEELEMLEEQLKSKEKRFNEQMENFRQQQANFEEMLEMERTEMRNRSKLELAELETVIADLKLKILSLEKQIEEIPSPRTMDRTVPVNPVIISKNPTQSTLRVKDVIADIPSYTGVNIPLERFSQSCRRARDALSPEVEGELVRAIRTKIFGRAYCAVEDDKFQTVEELLHSLRVKLTLLKSSYFYRGKLSDIYKGQSENILDYIQRVKDLKVAIQDSERQEGKGLDGELDKFVLECFEKGLPSNFRILLKFKEYNTLSDAYTKAILIANELEQEQARLKPPPLLNNSTMHFNNNIRKNNLPPPPPPPPQRFSQPPSKICSYCNKFGHLQHECFRNPRNRMPNSGNQKSLPPKDARPEEKEVRPTLKINSEPIPSTSTGNVIQ